jgi:hypothetical protein
MATPYPVKNMSLLGHPTGSCACKSKEGKMLRRLLIALLTVALTGCGARHHAQTVLAAYKTAVQQNDIPAFVRLADPNTRALIERDQTESKEGTVALIDTVTTNPVRIVTTPKGVVYLGWARDTCARCEWNLMPVVVGEGRAISKSSGLADYPGTNETTDWQVQAIAHAEDWRLAHVWKPADEAAVNTALATIDDTLLATWFFEGSSDARREILQRLKTHH